MRMRREEPVFHGDPAAADGHAAGDQAKELGEFATRNVFRLDPFDGKIDFGRGLLGRVRC